MDSANQRTLRDSITLDGIGVHSGAASSLTLNPADPNTGIVFRRTDIEGSDPIPADLDYVVGTELGTSLGKGEATVHTIEHVMAALTAHQIDNCVLDLDGPEPPIRDGSFADYGAAICEAGIAGQDAPAKTISLTGPVQVEAGNRECYVAAASDTLSVSATIDFSHPAIGRQFGSFDVTPDSFDAELAPARTFGFREEAEALIARGLARGASLENTIVLDADGIMNDGLRFPDEYVRHKIGDIVGDLGLLGSRLACRVIAERPSHSGNVELARAIRKQASMGDGTPVADVERIMKYLPHRYPMLLVDRIIAFESKKRVVGIKNVTINEPFFQGHFPGHPIMPGVLIIEAMAQVGGLLMMDAVENPEDKVVYFMTLDNVKWRKPVTPGDQIVFEVEMVQFRRQVGKLKGRGYVDGQLVSEAELMARIVDR